VSTVLVPENSRFAWRSFVWEFVPTSVPESEQRLTCRVFTKATPLASEGVNRFLGPATPQGRHFPTATSHLDRALEKMNERHRGSASWVTIGIVGEFGGYELAFRMQTESRTRSISRVRTRRHFDVRYRKPGTEVVRRK